MSHATHPDGARATGASALGGARTVPATADTPARPPCTVCQRPDAAAINEALTAGRTVSSIAVTFYGSRTAKDTIGRHARKCLSLGDQKEARKRRSAASRRHERALNAIRVERVSLGSAAAVLEQHELRYRSACEIFEEARVSLDHRTAIAADQLRGSILNDAARLQGFEKSASPLVNFTLEVVRAKVAALTDDQLDRLIAGNSIPELIEGEVQTSLPAVLA